jgi:hypothetical protein
MPAKGFVQKVTTPKKDGGHPASFLGGSPLFSIPFPPSHPVPEASGSGERARTKAGRLCLSLFYDCRLPSKQHLNTFYETFPGTSNFPLPGFSSRFPPVTLRVFYMLNPVSYFPHLHRIAALRSRILRLAL